MERIAERGGEAMNVYHVFGAKCPLTARARMARKVASLVRALMLALVATVAFAGAGTAMAGGLDSTDVNRAGALPNSNCTNLSGTWYAVGEVPPGYYKSNGDGNCYPIPACPGGTAWNGGSQTCQSICYGGQSWNGSACVCPSGQLWNGSQCGTKPTASVARSVAGVTVGQSVSVSWSTGNSTSRSLSCSGAGTYSASVAASGSVSVALPRSGTMTCTLSAANSWGTTTASTSATASCVSGTAWNGSSCVSVCASGTTWNGSTCVSVCSGGTVWNGSSCVCPSGTVWNGSSCGRPAYFTSFGVGPGTTAVGSYYTVTWGAPNATSVALTCTGVNSAAFALNPPTSGSGALATRAAGSTSCYAKASNAWGSSTSATITVNATMPASPINGTATLMFFTASGVSGGLGNASPSAWYAALRFTKQSTSTRVEALDWGGVVRSSCNLTRGGACDLYAGGTGPGATSGRLFTLQAAHSIRSAATAHCYYEYDPSVCLANASPNWSGNIGSALNAAYWAPFIRSTPGGFYSSGNGPYQLTLPESSAGAWGGSAAIARVQMASDMSISYYLAFASSSFHGGCGVWSHWFTGAVGTLTGSQLLNAANGAVFYSSPTAKGAEFGTFMGCG